MIRPPSFRIYAVVIARWRGTALRPFDFRRYRRNSARSGELTL